MSLLCWLLLDHSKVKDPLRIGGVGKYPVHPFQHQDVVASQFASDRASLSGSVDDFAFRVPETDSVGRHNPLFLRARTTAKGERAAVFHGFKGSLGVSELIL